MTSCPAAVVGVTATAGQNSVTLAWTLADESPAIFVSVTPSDRILRGDGAAQSATITGLRNGVTYTFDVYAGSDESVSAAVTVDATPLNGAEGEVTNLIVKFDPSVESSLVDGSTSVPGEGNVTDVALSLGDEVVDGTHEVTLSDAVTLEQAEQIADQLASSPSVEWAEPDQFFFTSGTPAPAPNDPNYSSMQWNLWDAYGIAAETGTSAIATSDGAGTTVAVIDTGIASHPDLNANLVPGYDFVSDASGLAAVRDASEAAVPFDGDYVDPATYGEQGWDANPADPGDWRDTAPQRSSSWHGTAVAGVIAAQANNELGIVGVAPKAALEPIRALSWRGGLLSDIASAIVWASGGGVPGASHNANPATVINLSFSVETTCPATLQAAIDDAVTRGSLVVAAAGNAGDDAAHYAPGNCGNVLTIGATGRNGKRAAYSNYGSRVDLSAPGGDIAGDGGVLTTGNSGTTVPQDPSYAAGEGTSIAAAQVSGAAARLASLDKSATPAALMRALTGHDLVAPFADGACDPNSEKSCGAGILSLAQIATTACPGTFCAYDNGNLRFGTGSENSVNTSGNLQQPWYKSNQYYKLTYSSYPLDLAVGTGTNGSNWSGATVFDNPALSGQVRDYANYIGTVSGAGRVGYGTISSQGTASINGANLEILNTYSLGASDRYVQITTKVTNLSANSVANVNLWVGTRDDWVGSSDGPTKTKGNIVDGAFVQIANAATPAQALKITSGSEGVLFYSTSPGTNTSIDSCCSFSNAYRVNPTSSPLTLTGDGSYAINLPVGTLTAGGSTTLTWFYAAGPLAELAAVTQAVANAASPANRPETESGNGSVTLTWTAPQSQDPITDYAFRYSNNGGSSWSTWTRGTPSTATTETITGLTDGGSYVFQVAAITGTSPNTVQGAWSASTNATVPGIPDPPTGLSATAGDTSASISFTAGDAGSSAITNYQYSTDGTNWTALSPADAASPVTIPSLTNGTAYTLRLRAVNSYGVSGSSGTVSATPVRTAVSAAQSTIAAGAASIVANGSATTSVTVTVKDASGTQVPGGGYTTSLSTTRGSIGAVTDNHNGTFSATLTASTSTGSATISAVVDGQTLANTAVVTFTPGALHHFAVSVPAGSKSAGAAFDATVTAQDAYNNTATAFATDVTLSADTGSLDVTSAGTWSNGVVVRTIDLTRAGTRTITATETGAGSPKSGSTTATVVAAAASQLALSRNAASAASGSAFATQPQVGVTDAYGNVRTSDSSTSITMSVSAGATLVGTTSATASSGVATFANAGLTGTAGSSNTLTYTSGSLTSASQSITVTTGPGSALVLSTSAVGSTFGSTFTNQPVVRVRDTGSNTVTSWNTTVTATVTTSLGATALTSTASVANGRLSDGVATFSGMGTALDAGTYTITYTSGSLSSVSQSVTVSVTTPSLSGFANTDKDYSSAPFSLTAPVANGPGGAAVAGTFTYESANTAVATVVGNRVTVRGVGTSEFTATFTPTSANYVSTSTTMTLTVTKAGQATLTITSPSTLVYGSTLTLGASGGSGTGALVFTKTLASACTVSSSGGLYSLTSGGVGTTCLITATRVGDDHYLAKSSTQLSVTTTQASQTLTFTSTPPTRPVPFGTFVPSATSVNSSTNQSSELTVTLSLAPASASVCTMSLGQVTFLTAGTCTIYADQAGTSNYRAATRASQAIVVGSLNQSITFPQPDDVEYGSSSSSMTATTTSSLAATYSLGEGTTNHACTVSAHGIVTPLAVGICEVIAAQSGNAVYAAASSVVRTLTVEVSLPSAPHLNSVSASDSRLTVAFSAPGFTGGANLLGYEVVASPVGTGDVATTNGCATDASPLTCTIDGLVNGTAYTVTVAALNNAGTGEASDSSSSVTPATAAYAVSGLSASPGDGTLTVTWTPLADNQLGGGAFTRYAVSFRAADQGSFTTWSDGSLTSQAATTTAITGLQNAISYEIRVVAMTEANADAIAGNTATVTQYPSTTPSAPRHATVKALTATTVQLSWSDPRNDGGAALSATPFVIAAMSTTPGATSPITCSVESASDRRCIATGLTNGADYTFTVRAQNRMGLGASATDDYATPSDDATLSDLTVSSELALVPAFDALADDYSLKVPFGVSSLTVTPTTTDAEASVTVNDLVVDNESASDTISLAVGVTVVTVVVTAADPDFSMTYTVTVTRDPAPVSAPVTHWSPSTDISELPVPPTLGSGSNDSAVTLNGEGEFDVTITERPRLNQIAFSSDAFHLTIVVADGANRAVEGGASGESLQGTPGDHFDFAGDGYQSNSYVRVYLIPLNHERGKHLRADTTAYLGEFAISGDGSFTTASLIPASTSPGSYILQVNGLSPTSLVRSVNVAMKIVEAKRDARTAQQAGFFESRSAQLTSKGKAKLQELVRTLPAGTSTVTVTIIGVSNSMADLDRNLALAKRRAQILAKQLEAAGVHGTYTIQITTSFQSKATRTDSPAPITSSSGRPLTTVIVEFGA
ncbi:MAG: fibronectin type III domain-containing protein [Actinomycetes bacterium]